jgi:hypothetical protein
MAITPLHTPQISAFLLMTVFPQFFLMLYMTAFQEFIFPADSALGGLQLAMLTAETVAAYTAVRRISQKKTAEFHRVVQAEQAAEQQQQQQQHRHAD